MNITLSDFIKEAMTAIVHGIKEGQKDASVGDHIAPLIQGRRRNEQGNFHLKGDPKSQATIVQFDVQVTTAQGEGGKGHGKAKFWVLYVVEAEVGATGSMKSTSSRSHRLKFAVPVKLPKRGA